MRTVDSRLKTEPLYQKVTDAGAEQTTAWEMVEAGRYQPRRIRGSNPGRDLG